jgi:hypothetical protein
MRNLLSLSVLMLAKHTPAEHPKNGTSNAAPSSESMTVEEPFIPPTDPEVESVQMSSTVELLKKLVAKDIVKRSQLVYQKDDSGAVINPEPRALYRVFGQLRDTKNGMSNYGEWNAFIGSFEAIRHADHQRFQSATLHLQNPAEGLLLDHFHKLRKEALEEAKKTNPNAQASDYPVTVIFAFDIGCRPSPKWVAENVGNSYEYTVRTVFESDTTDPLTALRSQATKSLPRLQAPPK